MKIFRILILILATTGVAWGQASLAGITINKDLVYKTIGNWNGRLDIYIPEKNPLNPLVMYIHGGGWTHGNKEAEYDKFKVFIENGLAVANVEYRLANQAPAPAAIEDVNCALAYIIQHAKELRIDKRKIILIGGSAGAHLALMLGLPSNSPIYTGGCDISGGKILGIISKYGPTDLPNWGATNKPGGASMEWVGNRAGDSTFLKSLSPIYNITTKIPVLLVHGDKDRTVPVQQSLTLLDQLKKNGNPVDIHIVKNGGHGNFGEIETPIMDKEMIRFVKKHLKLK